MTWATSSTYGSVVLGPAQAAVWAQAYALTGGGRRPYVTLGRLAQLSGRPVSSVHSALVRLRALGLVGVASTMGRRGGNRLWRPNRRPSPGGLNVGRHRRAVARILALSNRRPTDEPARPVPGGLWRDDPALPTPARREPPPVAPAPGAFDEAMRRNGFEPWWEQGQGSSESDARPTPRDAR